MVPIESNDISKDFKILLNELKMYNPDLVDKPRMLAITKCDIVEQEYIDLIAPEIVVDCPFYFISSVSGYGLVQLKDALWEMMDVEVEREAR
jgi:GTP-binding protein